jgi:hypothetical protein
MRSNLNNRPIDPWAVHNSLPSLGTGGLWLWCLAAFLSSQLLRLGRTCRTSRVRALLLDLTGCDVLATTSCTSPDNCPVSTCLIRSSRVTRSGTLVDSNGLRGTRGTATGPLTATSAATGRATTADVSTTATTEHTCARLRTRDGLGSADLTPASLWSTSAQRARRQRRSGGEVPAELRRTVTELRSDRATRGDVPPSLRVRVRGNATGL